MLCYESNLTPIHRATTDEEHVLRVHTKRSSQISSENRKMGSSVQNIKAKKRWYFPLLWIFSIIDFSSMHLFDNSREAK